MEISLPKKCYDSAGIRSFRLNATVQEQNPVNTFTLQVFAANAWLNK